jgi:hypothetical protein
MNHTIALADHLTSYLPDLQEQLITVEAAEVLEIFNGFINDAAACGCSAAAFRVLLAAAESAANRVLAEIQSEVIQ